ncbi:alanine racemase [Leucobacter sp. M11]|uniref:alanine racemase n=1 Tax=Leucobacter sp. M11 TaxID=2993565 RepID=UPI002D7EF2A0|nr:alanine racemase [Leucobacter sp. M11]MEB4614095.1 alanine racemase [Leucobacter sp. M11]
MTVDSRAPAASRERRLLRAAEISLPALRHNIRTIRRVTGSRVIVVVKAGAYGHGAEIVAPAVIAAGAAMVAVASLDEAVALRESGCAAPVLCWLHDEEIDADLALRHGIELGLSSVEQLGRLTHAAERAGITARAQLKVDTGLSRNGAAPETWAGLCAEAARAESAGRLRVTGVFSHLANTGDAEDRTQAARFDAAVRLLAGHGVRPPLRHLAASAAAFSAPALRYDAVRVGLAAYGLSPLAAADGAELGLRPVMTLAAPVVSLRRVPAGTGVSYGFTHVCERESVLALVPIGYADGMPRALNGSGATVSLLGERVPIIGRIGMDQCILDVTGLADRVRIGDRVVLFGDPARGEPPVTEWAGHLGTIPHEIVTGIGPRVARLAVGEG